MGDLDYIPGLLAGGGVYAGEGVSNLKHRCDDKNVELRKFL